MGIFQGKMKHRIQNRKIWYKIVDKILNKTYEVAIANHPFLLEETIACAKKQLETKSWDAVGEAVVNENLLNTKAVSTGRSYFRAIKTRLEGLPSELLHLLSDHDAPTSSYTLFYVLLHKNRLLREMMEEIVRDKALESQNELDRQEVKDFFERKRKNNQALAEWSDTTWKKFWQNTLKSAIETGVLKGLDPLEIKPVAVPDALKDFLMEHNEEIWLHIMLDFRF